MTNSSALIVQHILASPKYQYLDPAVVQRIVTVSERRYGSKRAEQEAKRLLHQIWGMYYAQTKSLHTESSLPRLLEQHKSTRERLPFLREFYDRIFAVIGQPVRIVDYGCGLNPLAFATLGYAFPSNYNAFDIDQLTVSVLNQWFEKLALSPTYSAQTGDLLQDSLITADVTFLLKVLPPLELQQKGASRLVLEKVNSAFVVVSFPVKSVSGRDKGMIEFYGKEFMKQSAGILQLQASWLYPTELVFVLEKS